MPSCFVCGRTRNIKSKELHITFHRFPTDSDTKKSWNNFLLLNALCPNDVTKSSLICSTHFQQHDLRVYSKKNVLSKTAVPSILISRVKSAKKLFPEQSTQITSSMPNCNVYNQGSDSPAVSTNGVSFLDVNSEVVLDTSTENQKTKQCFPEVYTPNTSTSSNYIDQKLEQDSPTVSMDGVSFLDAHLEVILDTSTKNQKVLLSLKRGRRKQQKIDSLSNKVNKLKKDNLLNEDAGEVLLECSGYGSKMSMIQPSNTMSDNDRLVPCCSTSNPIPSSSITDSNPSCSKTTQISNSNSSSLNESCSNPGPSNEDEELALPRASINKMIKDALPNIRVANDVREMIMNCCTEFIHLVASEANQVCMAQQKKTINAEHLLTALDHLGFGDYRAQAEEVGKDCQSKRRRQSTRLENLGIPEEELLRQQQELFAKAREEQMAQEQQQWQELQAAAQRAAIKPKTEESSDEDDYS